MEGFNDSNLWYSENFIESLKKSDRNIQARILRILNGINKYGLTTKELLIPDSGNSALKRISERRWVIKYDENENEIEIIIHVQVEGYSGFLIERLEIQRKR